MGEVTPTTRRPLNSGSARDPFASEQVLWMRIGFGVVIATAVALLPMFGDRRVAIGVVLLVLTTIANVHGIEHVRRTARPSPLVCVSDILLALALVAIVPDVMAVAAIVTAGGVTLFMLWFGPRVAALAAASFEVGLGVIAYIHAPALWLPTMIAFAVSAAGTTTGLHRLIMATKQVEERHLELVNGLDAVVWESGPDGQIEFASGNVAEVVGCANTEFQRPGFYYSRIHPDDIGELERSRAAQAEGHDTETHIRVRDDSGRYRHIQERLKVVHNPDGTVRLRRGLVVDESDRWEAESGLRRHMDFIHGIPVALVVLRLVDPEDPESIEISSLNPAAEKLVEGPAEGARLLDVLEVEQRFLRELANVALGSTPLERPFVNLPGIDAVYTLRAVPLPERHVGVTLEDITKRARVAESFRHQAMHDELTGLPNRAQFQRRLATVMSSADPAAAALLIVDLDQFKEINDALGHEYGDSVLREFSQRLASNLRGCDLIARLGGDEFAVLITDDPGETAAIEIAERLLQLCDSRFEIGDFRFQVGASVGVALAPEHAQDADGLMRLADTAMYRAKAQGGGWAVFSENHDDNNIRRLELMADLRDALTDDQFVVHYQPRIDLRSGRIVGVEALVRWSHPRYGLLAPEEFIELAEVSGCIRELTECVGSVAVAELGDLLRNTPLRLSLNLSTRTLYDPRLLTWVSELVEDQRIPDGSICFEIREPDLMEDPTRSMSALSAMRELGVRFSVDDFGTGYSSLSYLRELPIDEVKIDRSFVADLAIDNTIVRAVVDLGHNLGLHVVAEGVEDEQTAQLLRTLHCDSAQGFFWARAVPMEELRARLETPDPRIMGEGSITASASESGVSPS